MRHERDPLREQFEYAIWTMKAELRRNPPFGANEERLFQVWHDFLLQFCISWWEEQGKPTQQLTRKRELIREVHFLVFHAQEGRVDAKYLLPNIVGNPISPQLTTIVCGDSTVAGYILNQIEEWSAEVRDAVGQAADYRWVADIRARYAIPGGHNLEDRWAWHGWNDADKIDLIRRLLLYLRDVVSPVDIKQEDLKQEDVKQEEEGEGGVRIKREENGQADQHSSVYRSRSVGRRGESSGTRTRRSRSPEHSDHSLAHSLLNQPLSARKARIYRMI